MLNLFRRKPAPAPTVEQAAAILAEHAQYMRRAPFRARARQMRLDMGLPADPRLEERR